MGRNVKTSSSAALLHAVGFVNKPEERLQDCDDTGTESMAGLRARLAALTPAIEGDGVLGRSS